MSVHPGRPLAGLAPEWRGPGPDPAAALAGLPALPPDASRRIRAATVLVVTEDDASDPRGADVASCLADLGVGELIRADVGSWSRAVPRADVVVDVLPRADARLADRAAELRRPVLWADGSGWSAVVGVAWPPWSPCRPCAGSTLGEVTGGAGRLAPPVRGWTTALLAALAVQTLLGVGDPSLDRLLHWDALAGRTGRLPIALDPGCRRCGTAGPAQPGGSQEDASAPVRTAADVAAAVVELVHRIPPGRVLSYGDIARRLGLGSARQVGQVMAGGVGSAPWWRVVRADGGLPPGLVERAHARLTAEGTPVRGPDRVDMARARWDGDGVGAP